MRKDYDTISEWWTVENASKVERKKFDKEWKIDFLAACIIHIYRYCKIQRRKVLANLIISNVWNN